jgi:segregation and condensation protein B
VEPKNLGTKSIIEALIFAADEPVTLKILDAIFNGPAENGQPHRVPVEEIRNAIAELNEEYNQQHRAFRIIQVGGGFQFATRPEYAEWVGELYKEKGKRKLSHSALETLSIIAYRQPVTKPEIEAIRGVNADYVLHTLLERGLVTITGRASTVGRPLLYGTTKEFLKHFGINDLSDLPKPRELEEIMAERNLETDRKVLEVGDSSSGSESGDQPLSSAESANEPSTLEVSPEGLLRPPAPTEPERAGPSDDERSGRPKGPPPPYGIVDRGGEKGGTVA